MSHLRVCLCADISETIISDFITVKCVSLQWGSGTIVSSQAHRETHILLRGKKILNLTRLIDLAIVCLSLLTTRVAKIYLLHLITWLCNAIPLVAVTAQLKFMFLLFLSSAFSLSPPSLCKCLTLQPSHLKKQQLCDRKRAKLQMNDTVSLGDKSLNDHHVMPLFPTKFCKMFMERSIQSWVVDRIQKLNCRSQQTNRSFRSMMDLEFEAKMEGNLFKIFYLARTILYPWLARTVILPGTAGHCWYHCPTLDYSSLL